jgi:hypothetical protein
MQIEIFAARPGKARRPRRRHVQEYHVELVSACLQNLNGANKTCCEHDMGRCGVPHFSFQAIVEFDVAGLCSAPHVQVEGCTESRPLRQVILPFGGVDFVQFIDAEHGFRSPRSPLPLI